MSPYRAKKRLGQNFLKSKEIINRIVALVSDDDYCPIVEIGPGRGALTLALAKAGARVVAVEFDRDLIGYLTALLLNYPNVTIVKGDFLEQTPETLELDRFTLLGNLPYNITSPVIDWVLEYRSHLVEVVLMVQKEMAARLAAKPNSRNWSPLSIVTQLSFDVTQKFTVPPSSFRPSPEVDSAVVSMKPRSDEILVTEQFRRVVEQSFKQRRKLLANNLAPEMVSDPVMIRDLIAELGWPEKIRAESLEVEQFLKLTDLLIARKLI